MNRRRVVAGKNLNTKTQTRNPSRKILDYRENYLSRTFWRDSVQTPSNSERRRYSPARRKIRSLTDSATATRFAIARKTGPAATRGPHYRGSHIPIYNKYLH